MNAALNLAVPNGLIKALSLKQPIAWLIANNYLLVDDRTWGTQHRGTILIHASKGLYQEYYDHLKSNTDIPLPDQDKLEYGGVIGIANLILCCRPRDLPADIRGEKLAHFNGVNQAHFGFLFEQATPMTFMPCRGKLGIFEINIDELLAAPPTAQANLF